MINKELIGWVRYPDEPIIGFDDRIDYYDFVAGQKLFLSNAKGQDKKNIHDTLIELERRWKERQEKASRKNISSSRKKSREVVYPNGSI